MAGKASFHWDDPLLLNEQLTDEERMVRDAAAAYCSDRLRPRVIEAFRKEQTDASIFREMGELGLLGPTIPAEYGGAGQEELFAPEPVSEIPEGNEERADDEPVDVENP